MTDTVCDLVIKISGTPAKKTFNHASSTEQYTQTAGTRNARKQVVFDDIALTHLPESHGSSVRDSSQRWGQEDKDNTPIFDGTHPKKRNETVKDQDRLSGKKVSRDSSLDILHNPRKKRIKMTVNNSDILNDMLFGLNQCNYREQYEDLLQRM